MNYNEGLKSGKVCVRKIWVNENSNKDQVSVQMIQVIDNPNFDKTQISDPLVALAQGINGQIKQTAIMSFKKDIAIQYFGTTSANYAEEDKGVILDEKLGIETGISVQDSFEPNPNISNHRAVINPKTQQAVTKDGKKFYRTSFVAPKADVVINMFKADKVEDNSTAARNVLATATIENV
jgi:hypothetical protein